MGLGVFLGAYILYLIGDSMDVILHFFKHLIGLCGEKHIKFNYGWWSIHYNYDNLF